MYKSVVKTILIAFLIVAMTANLTFSGLNLVFNQTVLNISFYEEIFLEQHFYKQLRQWVLLRISTELPHGREGLAYFEKGLTDNWIRQELLLIMNYLSMFLDGESDELPELRIYKFKEAVMENMLDYNSFQKKEEVLDFWLGPLPHIVRLQDITSPKFLWDIRAFVDLLKNAVYFSLAFIFAFFGLIFILTKRIRETALWFSVSLFASGLLSLIISMIITGLIRSSDTIQVTQLSMIAQGFHQDSIKALSDSFTNTIGSYLNIVSLLSALIGFLLICFIPLETEEITAITIKHV